MGKIKSHDSVFYSLLTSHNSSKKSVLHNKFSTMAAQHNITDEDDGRDFIKRTHDSEHHIASVLNILQTNSKLILTHTNWNNPPNE